MIAAMTSAARRLMCALNGHRWEPTDSAMDCEVHRCRRCGAERYVTIGDDY